MKADELKGVSIPASDATIMGMGIYEDTGSFMYTTTNKMDFDAASILMSNGMNRN